MKNAVRMISGFVVLMAWMVPQARAALVVATNSGNWVGPAVWSNGVIPQAGDDVVIASGKTVTLTNTTEYLRSFTNNGTLTFNGANGYGTNIALRAADAYVAAGATITHARNTDTASPWVPDSRIWIVCTNLTVAATATINADTFGYLGGSSYTAAGNGPGQGFATGTRGSGGGYGGKGANGGAGAAGGATYGSSNAPVDPGSGGGGNNLTASEAISAGGGAIRIEAANEVRLNGTIKVNGASGGAEQSMGGGGAGGSIWITCSRFVGVASGSMQARGGAGTRRDGVCTGGGGGGRIGVDYVVQGFLGKPSPGIDGDAVIGGTNTFSGVFTGSPGTLVWAQVPPPAGMSLVTIAGSPERYGNPAPDPYGDVLVATGTTLTNAVDSPAGTANGLRYACTGWTLAGTLGAPLDGGSSTQAVFTASTNSVLTWSWTNQYLLSLTWSAGGALTPDASGWYTNGDSASFTATPSNGFVFAQWVGTGLTEAQRTNVTVTIAMNQPRTLRALFASTSPTVRVWSASSGRWTDDLTWSPAGLPGPADTAIVRSGTVTIPELYTVGSLVVSNGATALFTNMTCGIQAASVTVYGTLTHAENSATAPSGGQWIPDARVYLKCDDLLIAANGTINVSKKGYRGARELVAGWEHSAPGYGPGRGTGTGTRGGGGGYGGAGGNAGPGYGIGGGAYGSTNAPVDPGSGGGVGGRNAMVYGNGGGVIRLDVAMNFTLDGTVVADGDSILAQDDMAGAGSGGSIYITCRKFMGAASGMLRAQGGAAYSGGGERTGGGGGGRIAVWFMGNTFNGTPQPGNDGTAVDGGTNLYAAASCGSKGTVFWNNMSPRGTVIILK